jgi:peptidoglycan/xylan/chitin deacetylase (PgdA/CDA1 family)
MRRQRGARLAILLITLVALVAALSAPAGAQAQTVVSLTLDDGWDNQYTARPILAAHGMKATFFVNTNTMGTSGFLSWQQLAALNGDGHEVAGHALDHVNLVAAGATEARRQICDDRANLLGRGFVVTSFAYPFGEYDDTVKAIVRDCGYASGRGAFGLRNITAPNDSRPYAGSMPPPDPYAVLTPCCVRSDVSLANLQNYIVQAENNGGGWVPLVLHRICDNCGADSPAPSMSPATFQAFVDWLAARAGQGTVVRTVSQVMSGDSQPPTSTASCNAASCSSGWYSGPVSVSLNATDSGSGAAAIRYTLDGSDPTVLSPRFTGPLLVGTSATLRYRAWDNAGNVEAAKAQVIRIDSSAPVSAITCNGTTCGGTAYGGSVTVGLSASDDAAGVAAIRYTLDGSEPTTTSPLYGEPFSVSATTTVRYRAWDQAGNVEATRSQLILITTPPAQDTTAPTSAAACNGSTCSTGWYAGPVSVTLSATDDASGVAAIRYTLDGTVPTTASPTYTAPFTVAGTTTVRYRAWDNAGNVESANTVAVRIDSVAPTVAITAPTDGATVKGVVKVNATASDTGSGVLRVSFYANGVLVGTKAGGGNLSVSWNTNKLSGEYTLTAVAEDAAGNVKTSTPVRVTVR